MNLLLNLFEPRKLFSSEHVMTPPRIQLGRSNLFLKSTPCSNSWRHPYGYYPTIQINKDFSCRFHVQCIRLVPMAVDSSVQILFCGKTQACGLNFSIRFTSEGFYDRRSPLGVNTIIYCFVVPELTFRI